MVQLGQKNAARQSVQVIRKLGNYQKEKGMGYPTYERGLQALFLEAESVNKKIEEQEQVTYLLMGMEADRRYRTQLEELTRCDASYLELEAHKLLQLRATDIPDLESARDTPKPTCKAMHI